MNDIDLVVLWVDGSDSVWLEERMNYEPKEKNSANISSRFRDWGIMKYWFRGIEKNIDWYRYIFFVTYGHVPKWLNLSNPRLKVVKHSDFIPKEYLPTYNSNVIELNLHRIDELSDNFILFNDDIFVIDKMKKEQFFIKGIPCDMLWAKVLVNYDLSNNIWHMVFNNMGIVNRHLSGGKKNFIHFKNWINKVYGKKNIQNFIMMLFTRYSSFYDFHFAIPYKRQTYDEVWGAEEEELVKTCNNRFRTPLDITHWVFRYWRLAKGEFVPIDVQKYGKYFEFTNGVEEIESAIKQKKYALLVLNDAGCEQQEIFEQYQKRVADAFETILPEKSKFEK